MQQQDVQQQSGARAAAAPACTANSATFARTELAMPLQQTGPAMASPQSPSLTAEQQ